MATAPNQRKVIIHREKCERDFLQIKKENWFAANKDLEPYGLQVYLYLAGNRDGFTLELSQEAAEREAGIKKTSFHKYVNLMIEKGYTKRVFSMYGGEQKLVEIRFINPLLDAVVDRFGTKDVQYGKVDETHFSVTAKVEISDQFFGWILGFGKKAKILYPDAVLDQFRAYMDKIREMY